MCVCLCVEKKRVRCLSVRVWLCMTGLTSARAVDWTVRPSNCQHPALGGARLNAEGPGSFKIPACLDLTNTATNCSPPPFLLPVVLLTTHHHQQHHQHHPQEINTVADMVNFEVKRKMYSRFSTGFGIFMIAQLCECCWFVFVGGRCAYAS